MSPRFGGGQRGGEPEAAHARTAEDREAARLERERRRAARAGRPLPEADEPAAVATEPVAEAPPEPEPVPEPPAPEDHVPSAPVVPEPLVAPEPPPEPPAPVAPEPPATEVHHVPGDEPPAGVRRVGAPSVRDLPRVAAPQPPERGRPRGLPKRRRGARRVIPVLLLALVVVVVYGAYRYAQPFHGAAHGTVRVTVPRGATTSDVADLLASEGVIDSAFFFNLHTRLSGQRSDIKAGTFTLQRDMTYGDALAALTSNPAAPPVLRVTIPEGRSIREAAPLVKQSGFRGSYVKAATRSPRSLRVLRTYNVPKGVSTLEGFLFPATYELKRHSTARQLVAEQLAQFRKELHTLDLREARSKNLTAYDVLIIASMIEREAQVPKDRRLISAVIYNRLEQHIPLGIDATLRYALNDWTRPLRMSELQTNSPFNTRMNQGLPPTPIGSPGLASLQAAVNPAHVSYLYYVVKPCGNGAHAFSSTDAQFQRDVAAYNHKRDQLGGKDPSHC